MDKLIKDRSIRTCPSEMALALNKAKTISWRLGVAWTLTSESREILICSGGMFNQHSQHLISDIQNNRNAKRLYITYCPISDDLNSQGLLEALQMSNLTELHISTRNTGIESAELLSKKTAIQTIPWISDRTQLTQDAGIDWVRSTKRPWVHVICSNSLGGGAYPIEKMSEQLGVAPFVTLKGVESSLLYVQHKCISDIRQQLSMASPRIAISSDFLISELQSLSAARASVVTVVCSQEWLADIIRMSLANEVSYFLSLRSIKTENLTSPATLEFPESEKWNINSSDVMGDFVQLVLQKGQSQVAQF